MLSAQCLCCEFQFYSGETIALSTQGSVQWIDVLQSASGEDHVLSIQGFVLLITIVCFLW